MGIQFSRVVTGVDGDGTSVCYSNEALPAHTLAMMPGARFYKVWGTEGILGIPVTDPRPDDHAFFPGPGGTRFGLLTFPPDPAPDAVPKQLGEAALTEMAAEAEEKFPGLIGAFEPDAPGMHQTVTVDYAIVLEGALSLELDNGAEVHLPTGTCVVQNGARHAWRNRGSSPATLAYVILAAE